MANSKQTYHRVELFVPDTDITELMLLVEKKAWVCHRATPYFDSDDGFVAGFSPVKVARNLPE